MEIITTAIPDVKLIKPRVFEDSRGYFFEAYNENVFKEAGLPVEYKQDNQSKSQKDVLRGLHFQNPPHAQGKLVRVIKGAVLDVAVDIRKNSPTYGKHVSTILSEQNKLMMYIPEGFAHGFTTLENQTIFFYKCTALFNKDAEGVILWNDVDLGIDWNVNEPILSERDKKGVPFKKFESNF